jgi:hypothetical protein
MTSAVNYGVKKPLNWVANTSLLNSVCKNYRADNVKYITALGITSIILKDGLGCYLYVKQSLNNKKIPSDKRKFVAALDMTNGGLMIGMQLLMFKTFSNEKFQEKIFGKLFNKYFDRPARKGYQALLKGQEKFSKITGKEFNTSFEAFKKTTKGTFGAITSLVAAVVIAKRVIVPFIATPLADKAKTWMCRNDKENEINPESKNTYNTNATAAQTETSTNLLKTLKG